MVETQVPEGGTAPCVAMKPINVGEGIAFKKGGDRVSFREQYDIDKDVFKVAVTFIRDGVKYGMGWVFDSADVKTRFQNCTHVKELGELERRYTDQTMALNNTLIELNKANREIQMLKSALQRTSVDQQPDGVS